MIASVCTCLQAHTCHGEVNRF